ncbi:MAG: nitrogenase component 1 [Desulfitobacteriaceae bacterium]|nr:nitrogenase component 1 [Desulfitobacteriaceae bacterium]
MYNDSVFENTLQYHNPSPARVQPQIRTGIPETHRLHVSPSACGRRFAISDLRHGVKENRSHLFISEDDIVSSCYEDLIPDAVEEMLTIMEKRPRAIIVYVTCIDNFLGTDHNALVSLLTQRFPDIKFTICAINPIARDKGAPPNVNLQNVYYGLLDRTDKTEDAVNLVGNHLPLVKGCEIFEILTGLGMKAKEICSCNTFDDFLSMADSRLNVVVGHVAQMAAERMEQKLGIPFLSAPRSYKIDEIIQRYNDMASALGRGKPDLNGYIARSREKLEKTRKYLNNMPIVVDSSGRPFALAKALLNYGFNVRMVFGGVVLINDMPDYEWIKNNRPDITIADARRFDVINANNQLGECLCIGFSGAYTLGAKHMVDMDGENAYGFYAIDVLMDKMYEAHDTTVDFNALLSESEVW